MNSLPVSLLTIVAIVITLTLLFLAVRYIARSPRDRVLDWIVEADKKDRNNPLPFVMLAPALMDSHVGAWILGILLALLILGFMGALGVFRSDK